MLPRRRTDGLVVRPLGDETLVYDLRSHRAHCLNRPAALVWQRCDGATTVQDLAAILQKELDSACDEALVWLALRQLGRKGLLERPVAVPGARCSRRAVLRRLGAFGKAALLAPVVLSILARPAFAQASCITNADCSSLNTACQTGTCQAGRCVAVPAVNGLPCGPNMTCQAGQCV